MALDKARLVAWLNDRSKSKAPLVGAIYSGLVDRIKRGEFDEEEVNHGTQ